VGGALVKVCCAAGLLAAARAVLAHLCAQTDPPAPPGAALLASFIAACARHEDAAVAGAEAARAFDGLSSQPTLALASCGEIWASLLPVCCAARRATDALRLFRKLRDAGGDYAPGAAAAADLLAALRAEGLTQDAFELQASLQSGVAAGGAAAAAAAGGVAAAAGGAAAGGAAAAAAAAAAGGGEGMEVDSEEGQGGAEGGANGAPPPAAASHLQQAAAAAAAAAGLTPDEHAASLRRLLDEAVEQARLEQAVEIVRQCGAAAVTPPEASVLALLHALFAAERPQHALGVHELLGGGGGGASVAVLAAVLQGLLNSKEATKLAVRAIALYNELREADADGSLSSWPELMAAASSTCLKADMLQDALDVYTHARATQSSAAAFSKLKRMRTALIAGCVKAQQLLKAHELFDEARQDGALPAAAALGSLLEVLCGRGYGLQALDVLRAMAEAAMPLSSRLCCLVMLALLRGGKLLVAYEVSTQRPPSPAHRRQTKRTAHLVHPAPHPTTGLRALPRARWPRRCRCGGGVAAHRGLQRRAPFGAHVQGERQAVPRPQGVRGVRRGAAGGPRCQLWQLRAARPHACVRVRWSAGRGSLGLRRRALGATAARHLYCIESARGTGASTARAAGGAHRQRGAREASRLRRHLPQRRPRDARLAAPRQPR